MKCSECGFNLPKSAKFCPQCGKGVSAAPTCPACQAAVSPGAKFCPSCGHGLDAPQAKVSVTKSPAQPKPAQSKPDAQRSAGQGKVKTVRKRSLVSKLFGSAKKDVDTEQLADPNQDSGMTTEIFIPPGVMRNSITDPSALKIAEQHWVEIPEGGVLIGSSGYDLNRADDERQHRVDLDSFQMMRAPVTFAMFDVFCADVGRKKPSDEGWGRGDLPVINVSYWDAVDYSIWLSLQTGWRCRLPTEAEWEYACRAGTLTAYWFGDRSDSSRMHCSQKTTGDAIQPRRVGTQDANPWGLSDMHGNVLEWCASEYDPDYSGKQLKDASDNRKNEAKRVMRGGSWDFLPQWARAAARYRGHPDHANNVRGFRLVRDA